MPGSNSKLKKPQKLTQQLKPKSGTKSSASGTKLQTLLKGESQSRVKWFILYLSLALELLDPVGPEGEPALDEHPDDPTDEGQEGPGPVDLLNPVLNIRMVSK